MIVEDGYSLVLVLLVILACFDLVVQVRGNVCDLYNGSWVYDASYPLYEASDCPFIQRQFDCQLHGRPDLSYLKFGWLPSQCSLPRFDGVNFLRRLRGKKIMFVRDSISLNQWQSLACMLHRSSPQTKYRITRTGGLSDFIFPSYNTSLMFSRDGFLIKIANEKIGRVVELNSVSQGHSWQGIDILVFNTWHEKGLRTWAKWVDLHLNSSNIKVFFQGVSPDHMNALNWANPNTTSTCVGETLPMHGRSSYGGGEHPAEKVVEKVVGEMSKSVILLKITRLSQMRKDGHPRVYGIRGHRLPDCSHWCLPGVPDTWNHLLYASLLH